MKNELEQIFEYRKGELFEGHYDITIKYIRQYSGADPIIDGFIKLVEQKFRKNYKEFKKRKHVEPVSTA